MAAAVDFAWRDNQALGGAGGASRMWQTQVSVVGVVAVLGPEW